MTAAEVFARARRVLGDTVAPYRWSDAELRIRLQDALRRLNGLHGEVIPATICAA